MAGWKIKPQKTRGKTANRAARVFIVDFLSGRIARRAFQSAIPLLRNSIVLRFYFCSLLLSHRIFLRMKNARPCDFCLQSAGFIALCSRVFSVNSAQTMPSQRIFSIKISVTTYSSYRKHPPTVVFPQIGGCFTFSVQKYVLRIKDSPLPQSHLSTT